MKKVLVVLLSLCMVLGCFSFASASSYKDVADSASYAPAVEVLSGIKILEGDGDGNFRPADSLKRVEACVILVKLLGKAVLGEVQTKTNFSDVPASYWGSGWVATAANLGLIEGYGDGTFGPEDKLTYDQWLTMILRVMGYTDDVLPGEWPTNFQVKALDLKLVDGTKIGSKPMPRGEVAEVAFDALISNGRVEYDAKGNLVKKPGEIKSFLEDLGGKKSFEGAVVTDKTSPNYGKVGTEYVMKDENGKDQVVAFVPDASYTTLTGVKFDATKKTLGTYAIDPALTATISTENGGDAADKALHDGVTYDAVVKINKDGKTVDEVKTLEVWTLTDTIQITKENVADIEKALKAAKADAKTISFLSKNWKIADVKALVKDDVVSYYANGTDVNKIEVCKDVASGTVTKFDSATNKFTVGGSAYKLSADTSAPLKGKTEDVKKLIGKDKAFFLTSAGELFAEKVAEEAAVEATNYAVVTTKGIKEEGKDATVYESGSYKPAQIELLTADGKKAVYSVEKKFNETLKLEDGGKSFAAGTIVKYNLNASGELNALEAATTATIAKGDFTWNKATGILSGKLLANNVMVVNKDGVKYAVKAVSDIPATVEADATVVANKDGKYEVLVYTGKAVAADVSNVGLFTSDKYVETYDSTLKANVYTYNVLLNGKEDTVVSKATLTPTVGQLSTITVAGDKTVTATPYTADKLSGKVTDASTGLVAIDGTYYPLATNAVVYTKTTAKAALAATYAVGTQSDIIKKATIDIYGKNSSGYYTIVYVTVDYNSSDFAE